MLRPTRTLPAFDGSAQFEVIKRFRFGGVDLEPGQLMPQAEERRLRVLHESRKIRPRESAPVTPAKPLTKPPMAAKRG